MTSVGEAARALAQRLRELREREWPDATITQQQLAHALGASSPLISSWETGKAVPPEERLIAYATFFASKRSVGQQPYRLLPVEELSGSERARQDALRRELLAGRDAVWRSGDADVPTSIEPLGGPWHFGDAKQVVMVCAEIPQSQRRQLPKLDDPEAPYADLYRYADLDALFELHGHIRAANPRSLVKVLPSSWLEPDDYASHLVVLGGVDWNIATRNLLRLSSDMPIEQRPGGLADSYFAVKGRHADRFYAKRNPDGLLRADVGHFFRAPNPINRKRTVTICNGISSRGVFGAVRALTDEMFRDRNTSYLADRFRDTDVYSILMRVLIVERSAMTPDWTQPGTILHDWPEASG